MNEVLVAYASKYGSTREVAEAVGTALRECGTRAAVRPARDVDELDGYSAVVLGAPLYFFRWHSDARHFLRRHKNALLRPAGSGVRPGPYRRRSRGLRETRKQLDRAVAKFEWLSPRAVMLFGGKFDPAVLRFPDGKAAMKSMPASDIRDWDAIRAWAGGLPEALGGWRRRGSEGRRPRWAGRSAPMQKLDLRRDLKYLYEPRPKKPATVRAPEGALAVDDGGGGLGKGQEAIGGSLNLGQPERFRASTQLQLENPDTALEARNTELERRARIRDPPSPHLAARLKTKDPGVVPSANREPPRAARSAHQQPPPLAAVRRADRGQRPRLRRAGPIGSDPPDTPTLPSMLCLASPPNRVTA